MYPKVIISLILCIVCLRSTQSETLKRMVHVTVYYESLCPDSKDFFSKQLYPTLQKNISSFINLTLVPYGLSNMSLTDGDYTFSCHHGTYECIGNLYQACAIHNIPADPAVENKGFNPTTVGFINCLMSKVKKETSPGPNPIYEFPIKACAEIHNVPNYAVTIENCRAHPDGRKYLAEMGAITDALQPKLESVPTIVFDGKYNKEDSTNAQKDFVQTLCKHIEGDQRPSECKSAASTAIISVLAVAFALLKHIF